MIQTESAGAPALTKPRLKFWKSPLFRYGFSAIVLAILLTIIPFHKVWAAMRTIPLWFGLAMLGCFLAAHLLGVEKWRLMINVAGAGLSYPQAVRCYYWGLFGNIFLPSMVGGDIVRAGMAFLFARSRPAVVLGSLIDRMQDMGSLMAVTLIGIALVPGSTSSRTRMVLWMTAGLLAACAALGVALLFFVPARRFSFKRRRTLVKVRRGVRSMARHPERMVFCFILGMILQTSLAIINCCLGNAIGLHLSPALWLFAWPLAKLTSLFGFTQGGIGVREAALVFLLLPFGAPADRTLAVGLTFQAILISGGLVAGIVAIGLGQIDALKTHRRSA